MEFFGAWGRDLFLLVRCACVWWWCVCCAMSVRRSRRWVARRVGSGVCRAGGGRRGRRRAVVYLHGSARFKFFIYMYYVLCRTFLSLQPLRSALLFWRVAAALSCGPTTIPLLRLCVCMSVGGCPSSRGTQALWCRAECEKSLTTCVSLWQDSLLPRAARY